jgi:hypothetical protein
MRKSNKFHPLKLLAAAGYSLGVLSLGIGMVLGATPASVSFAQSGSGAIWTTTDSCGDPQNVNHYVVGAVVYINGANFDPAEAFVWDITRVSGSPPKPTVASGNEAADGNGAFCFAAYTLLISDVGNTYQATVGDVKSDNFRVEAAQEEPTNTPLPTNTPVPPTNTPVPPTDTPVPPTDTPVPPTNTPVPPTDTPVPPTNTPVPPTDTPEPTDVPPTDTPVPTDVPPTDTPVPTDDPPTETPDPVDPTATAIPATNVPPTSVPPTDVPPPVATGEGVLIPVTGIDFNASAGMLNGLFSDLGIALLGFGLLMHGAWLHFGKEE